MQKIYTQAEIEPGSQKTLATYVPNWAIDADNWKDCKIYILKRYLKKVCIHNESIFAEK